MTNMFSVQKINFTQNPDYSVRKKQENKNNMLNQVKRDVKTSYPKADLLNAYMVPKTNKINNANSINGSYKNNLKTLFNNNEAKIMAIIPRTFTAEDSHNGDGLIQTALGEQPGSFVKAVKKLDEIKGFGVNVIHVLPIHPPGQKKAMGTAGSVYAPLDFLKIDPVLDDKNDPRTVEEEFKYFIDECHKRGIKVMLDLPSCASYDLYKNHPELMAKDERTGFAKTPQGWNDIRMLEPWEDKDKKILNKHVLDLHKKYVDKYMELGIDGIRADVSRAKPPEFWSELIPYSRKKDPEFGWLAETYTYEDASPQLNMPYDRPDDALNAGFDLVYGQYHIFHEWPNASDLHKYVIEQLEMSYTIPKGKALIGSFSTHDDISPMFHGKTEFCNLTTGLQATLPMLNPYFIDGFQTGDYYLYPYANAKNHEQDVKTDSNESVVHAGRLDIFNLSAPPKGKNPEIGEFMKSAFKVRDKYKDVITKGSYAPLEVRQNNNDKIIAYTRHYKGKTLLCIANRNINERESGKVIVPEMKKGAKLENLFDSYGQKSFVQADTNCVNVNLGPARILCFEIDTPNIQKNVTAYRQNL